MAKYNLKERTEKNAAYRQLIRADLMDELYEKILEMFVAKKKYRDPNYTAKQLAEDLNTNTRYISALVNVRFRQNYANMVNEFRIKDAMYLLVDKRYIDKTMEEISAMVGFANRQSFYAAFYKHEGITPRAYRMNHLAQQNTKK